MLLSWRSSFACLACGHILHACHHLGPVKATTFFVWSVSVCIFIEEIGLQTGYIFGPYFFSDTLGFRITNNLPLMVPVMWQCFSYPCLLLARAITTPRLAANSKRKKGRALMHMFNSFIKESTIASLILVGFDLVSEPVAVSQGHSLWEHMAYVNSSLSSYIDKPDWHFKAHSFPQYFEQIPITNFAGWFFMGFVIYMGYNMTSGVNISDRTSFISLVPVTVAIYATQVFYIVHLGHATYVRIVGIIYLAVLTISLCSATTK